MYPTPSNLFFFYIIALSAETVSENCKIIQSGDMTNC